MAQGAPPANSYVDMRQGLWVVPRWLGIETAPATVLVLLEAFGFIARSSFVLTVATVLVLSWYWIFREAFSRDEQMIALMLRNRHYLRLIGMRAEALVSSPVEHLDRIL
jgi:hypothetical protein